MISELDKQVAKENYLASVEFLKLGLKGCFLLNGGAIIALLTYIGNSHASSKQLIVAAQQALPDFIQGVWLSVIALFIAVTAYAARYQHESARIVNSILIENINSMTEVTKNLLSKAEKLEVVESEKIDKIKSKFDESQKAFDLLQSSPPTMRRLADFQRLLAFALGIWATWQFLYGTKLALLMFK